MSTLSSIGSYASSLTSAPPSARPQRPDPTQMADQLFAQLDTKGQGFIEKSDLQSAFSQISGTTSSSTASNATGSSASVDEVFSQLDADGDGKVTQDEMSSSMKKLADELDSQFNQMRMSGGMGGAGGAGGPGGPGGMPPPPPPPGGDEGLTKDELTHQLSEIGSSDSKRSDLMSKVANNFEAADTDGNGKVSFQEAMAYNQESSTSSTTSSSSGNTSTAAASNESTRSSSSTGNDLAIMKRIMDLMQAYGSSDASGASGASGANGTNAASGLLSTLSVSV